MTAKGQRAALATDLATALDGWAVYASPPEVTAAPAAVIGPRDPYITRLTYTQYDLGLRVSLVLPRAAGADAMDVLDDAIETVRTALLALDYVAIVTVGNLGAADEGDVKYLMAAIDITLAYDPTEADP